MILILLNFYILSISKHGSMLVQAGSFRIPFSLLETIVAGDDRCGIFSLKHCFVSPPVLHAQVYTSSPLLLSYTVVLRVGTQTMSEHLKRISEQNARFASSFEFLSMMSNQQGKS